MKKVLSLILALITLLLCLIGCDNGKSYKVTVENDQYLYERLERRYKAGEQVVVKCHMITDVSMTVYMNGKSLGTQKPIKTDDKYTHWEYYFTMPSENVTLTFEVKDGFDVLPSKSCSHPKIEEDDGDGDVFDSGSSNAGYYSGNDIIETSLNFDKIANSSVEHLPLYKFDTYEEWLSFKDRYENILNIGFEDVDRAYFEEFTLFLAYKKTNSSSYRYKMCGFYFNNEELCIHIEEITNAEIVDNAMDGWFISLSLDKPITENMTVFDAVLEE